MLQRMKAEAQHKKSSSSGSIVSGGLSSSARAASGILSRTPSSVEKLGGSIKGRLSNTTGSNSTSSRISLKDRNSSLGNKGTMGLGTSFSPTISTISEASPTFGISNNSSLTQTSSRTGLSSVSEFSTVPIVSTTSTPYTPPTPSNPSTSLQSRTSQSKLSIKNPQPAGKK